MFGIPFVMRGNVADVIDHIHIPETQILKTCEISLPGPSIQLPNIVGEDPAQPE